MSESTGATDTAVDRLASLYWHLATAEFDGYCDLYAGLARHMADDPEMLARVVTMAPAPKVIPILLNAAVQHLLLAEPALELAAIYRGEDTVSDPWPLFRNLLIDRFDEVAEIVASHTIQTNEVGRSTALLPALTAVHRTFDRPLALVEIGPSAGLNLLLDHFFYDYGDGSTVGDPNARVRLTCEVRGRFRPPLASSAPPIVRREGIDLNPIDLRDDSAGRWLEACIWPGNAPRTERLRAAIAVARTDPPTLHRGSAIDRLGEVIGSVPDDAVACVTSTWVLAYFSPDDRVAFATELDRIGARRDLACVTAEYPSIAPWIPRPTREATDNAGQAATVLGIATWKGGHRAAGPVAWMQAHGQWIDWLEPGLSGAPPGSGSDYGSDWDASLGSNADVRSRPGSDSSSM